MKNTNLFNENNVATFCCEDDKIRLTIGRVSREEYEALRAEGWTSTPKQDCDFVAVWTPTREDTAISYAGVILDEDAGPDERAGDRAERFGGYLDKRLGEATGHADRFDAGPSAHGYQSKARAVRAADRHDRMAGRAVNAWDKAEYWQSRTAGVISHALHLSSPCVRMGRIKTLESELRKAEKSHAESRENAQARWDAMQSVVEHAAGTREKPKAHASLADFRWELSKIRESEGVKDDEQSTPEQVRRAVVISALTAGYGNPETWQALAKQAKAATRPAHEIAGEWLADKARPEDWNPEIGTRYTRHLKLRIAYEMQMLEAQGGRAAMVEMEPGGFIGGHQIHKVNKSPATGRVVSVGVKVRTHGKNRWGREEPGTPEFRTETVNIERASVSSYRAPTDEDRAEFADSLKAGKKATKEAAKGKPAPAALVNPTPEDAERLQVIIAAQGAASRRSWGEKETPAVFTMTQAQYSELSKGSYARAGVVEIRGGGRKRQIHREVLDFPAVVKVRLYGDRVVILSDKPQKALPAETWQDPAPAALAEALKPENVATLRKIVTEDIRERTPEQETLISNARRVGVFFVSSWSQFGFTENYSHLLTVSPESVEA